MAAEAFVLNLLSGILHTDPANESCNVDAMRARRKLTGADTARQMPRYRRDCRRCMERADADNA